MSASIRANADAPMSVSKYTLPPPVYLPSSGGYTSSRLVSEVSPFAVHIPTAETAHHFAIQPFHRRVFAFRRYSIEDDGRLVVRTRNGGRDSYVSCISCRTYRLTNTGDVSRHKPYERPFQPPTVQPSNQQGPPAQDGPPRKQVDGATLSRLFQQLAPLMKDPSNFESNAAPICASFDLDPATSMEIVNSFRRQSPADGVEGSKCVRLFYLPCLTADVKFQSARDEWTHHP